MVERPREPHLLLEDLESGDEQRLVLERSHDGVRFESPDLSGERLRDLGLVECELISPVLEEADLGGCSWREVRVEGATATSCRLAEARWREVEWTGGRIGALEAYAADLAVVTLREARVDYLNLRGSSVSDLLLVDCHVGTLALTEARAQRVALRDCVVDELVLTRAELSDVDLRGARLTSVTGLAGLRGATVSPSQLDALAPLLADEWGIRVG